MALELPQESMLPNAKAIEAIIEGRNSKIAPGNPHCHVTTILGLIPLAIGLNIDFFSLFSEWDPKIFIGGDNVIFWGPLAKTVIFGLSFATFLTLIIVPATFPDQLPDQAEMEKAISKIIFGHGKGFLHLQLIQIKC